MNGKVCGEMAVYLVIFLEHKPIAYLFS